MIRSISQFLLLCTLMGQSQFSFAELPDSLFRNLKPNEIIKLKEKIKKNPKDSAKYRIYLSEHYYRKRKWGKVIKILDPIKEQLDLERYEYLLDSYLSLKNYDGAMSLLKSVKAKKDVKNTTDAGILEANTYKRIYEHGNKYGNNSRFLQMAIDTYQKTASSMESSFAPEDLNSEVYEGWLEVLKRHRPESWSKAIQILNKIVKLEGSNEDYLAQHCFWYSKGRFIDQALRWCNESVKNDPKNPVLRIDLARAYLLAGNKQQYTSISFKAAKRFPQSLEVQRHAGGVYKEQGNMKKAYEHIHRALKTNKQDPDTLLILGESAFALKKYDEALKAFTHHCYYKQTLMEPFRRASGLLKNNKYWHKLYRSHMVSCKKGVYGKF